MIDSFSGDVNIVGVNNFNISRDTFYKTKSLDKVPFFTTNGNKIGSITFDSSRSITAQTGGFNSVTKNGTGDFTVNYSSLGITTAAFGQVIQISNIAALGSSFLTPPTTTSARVSVYALTGPSTDPQYISVLIIGYKNLCHRVKMFCLIFCVFSLMFVNINDPCFYVLIDGRATKDINFTLGQ